MRRTSANVECLGRVHNRLAAAVAQLDDANVDARVTALSPFVTDARLARLTSVIERRVASVTLLLDSLHDPYNGAAVVRSSDAFGLSRIHVIERYESFLAARTVARGSEQWVDVITHRTASGAAEHLVQAGFELITTHPEGELLPEDLSKIERPFALVMGNERDGIDPCLRAASKRAVRVPMRGYAESLNVSVTAAILLSTLMRDRPGDLTRSERARLMLRGLLQTIPRGKEVLEAQGLALQAAV